LSQPGDETVSPLAEVGQAGFLALGDRRGRRHRDRFDPTLRVERGDARPLRQLGRAARLLGGVNGRSANRHHRLLGGPRGRQRLVDAPLELADQRRPRMLGQQPVLGGVACRTLHLQARYGGGRRTPLPPNARLARLPAD